MIDVRQARETLGFSQAELAQVIGVTGRTIQNWEAGISKPRPKQEETINKLLNILPPPNEAKETDTMSRLISIIESQQRFIESQQRIIETLSRP